MLTTAYGLVAVSGLGLDLVSGWLLVIHSYLHYFRLLLHGLRPICDHFVDKLSTMGQPTRPSILPGPVTE